MSFKILHKTDATVDELAAAYADIEQQKADLEGQKNTAYAEMVDCQQAAMGGDGKAPAKLKKAKDAFQDIELQVDAAADALQKIRARIENDLPGDLQRRVAKLEAEREGLTKRQAKLRSEYLDKCAEAAVLNEQIRGRQFLNLPSSGDIVESTPSVGFDFSRMTTDDQGAFLEAVEAHRSEYKGKNLQSEIRDIDIRRERLEKTIGEGHFAAEAERLIDAHRPEGSAPPEPEKVRGKPTSTQHVVDYDRVRVEY